MTTTEERAAAADARAQELGPNDPPRRVVQSPGFIHATRPDDGVQVTFTPGEALPDWAAAVLKDAAVDEAGVYTLPDVMPTASPDSKTTRRRR